MWKSLVSRFVKWLGASWLRFKTWALRGRDKGSPEQ